jgi:hypothetical protein
LESNKTIEEQKIVEKDVENLSVQKVIAKDSYSCNECAICYDINEDPDEAFCEFCLFECDDEDE